VSILGNPCPYISYIDYPINYFLHVMYVISQELPWRQNLIYALSPSFCHQIQRCAKLNFVAALYAGSGLRLILVSKVGPTAPRGRDKSGPYALAIASLGLFRAVRHQYAIACAPSLEPVRTGMILV
jgi:hypothetical protein